MEGWADSTPADFELSHNKIDTKNSDLRCDLQQTYINVSS